MTIILFLRNKILPVHEYFAEAAQYRVSRSAFRSKQLPQRRDKPAGFRIAFTAAPQ